LSLHKSGDVYGITEKSDRCSFGKLPGTPEQLRRLWDAVVLKVVAE
jgi:molybdopterin-biosynthesis enzyme MoeA-like protein